MSNKKIESKNSKIVVFGHNGKLGTALVKKLQKSGYKKIITKSRKELDLFDANSVNKFFQKEKPEYVFLAAAKVGGITANIKYPVEFIYENVTIQNNVIHSAYLNKVKKLLFLGSTCIYPRVCPQPMKEEYFLTAKPEETNLSYAIAKIAGISMCQSYNKQYGTNFISAMPANLYGPNDHFDPEKSHVLPALIKRFHEAKEGNAESVTLWGTGKPRREFLYVDDLADACLFLMNNYNDTEIINVGSGEDISIKELAGVIKKIVGFKGKVLWDISKPDGNPRRLLDNKKIIKLGWESKTDLENGINTTYKWYLENLNKTGNTK